MDQITWILLFTAITGVIGYVADRLDVPFYVVAIASLSIFMTMMGEPDAR